MTERPLASDRPRRISRPIEKLSATLDGAAGASELTPDVELWTAGWLRT